MSGEILEGGCLCGAVRYRVSGEARQVEYCHCSMCRKSGGAPVSAWAALEAAHLEWPRGAPAIYRSSPTVERGFCARCGGQLTFRHTHREGGIALTVGSLDDPTALVPECHIFHGDALPWLRIADDLPQYTEDRVREDEEGH